MKHALFTVSKYFRLYLSGLLALIPWVCPAQGDIPVGTWRFHFPLREGVTVAAGAGQVLYAARAGIYFMDETGEGMVLSTLDGLSGNRAAAMVYHATSGSFFIAYTNGRLDRLHVAGGQFKVEKITLPTAQNLHFRRLYPAGTKLYAAAKEGVWVVDLASGLLNESWENLGSSGNQVEVHDLLFALDSAWIATAEGIARAPAQANLQDFNQWTYFTTAEGLPAGQARRLLAFQGKIFALMEGQGLYAYEAGAWVKINTVPVTLTDITATASALWVASSSALYALDAGGNVLQTVSENLFTEPRALAVDEQGALYVADARTGLLSNREGTWRSYASPGPLQLEAQGACYAQNAVLITAGGYNDSRQAYLRPAAFYEFSKGVWKNYAAGHPQAESLPFLYDLVDVAYNPFTQEYWFASFGNGILVRAADGSFRVIDEMTAGTPFFGDQSLFVSDIYPDAQGNMWVAQYNPPAGEPSLHVWVRETGQWQSFSFNSATRFPLEIVEDFNGYLWVRLDPTLAGGLWVLDPAAGQQKHLTASNAKLTNSQILSLAVDYAGIVWIGSADGVMTVFNTSEVFSPSFEVSFPIFENFQLLNDQRVLDIMIDPANRKWMSTEQGVFVFDENIDRLIYRFQSSNSPLLDDEVRRMVLFESTGEVFFLTAAGLCSFREGVTAAGNRFEALRVFPNPVRPGFGGQVAVEGLARNAWVKIVNVRGALIYEGRAAGGTFVWDTRSLNGEPAPTGVYLIFASDDAGTIQAMGRLAIVR
ncbi:type IX secretion system anionic LPS delivery protein PorZ [Thermonema rossianum]|uniref:type IX secretion system anionic LPS delivery protein PorZ n=1 Tax=Thermonema rossianum TaxID=55505 RepID=UPI00056ECAF7|nr:hypothetical protein [Thermonema rossianum]